MQEHGLSLHQVRKQLREARGEDLRFADGGAGAGTILGSMCTAPHEVAAEAHALFLETNLGDPAHFPGTARLEHEVLDDLKTLLHAPDGAAGRFLSGGTEANILACYLAREKTGKRTIVVPESAHFSFEKAARILGMTLKHVRTTPSGHADPAAMARAITKDTALVVAIAGTTELGLIDPVQEVAAVCRAKDALLYVDAAYGGYMIPFLAACNRVPRSFDFEVAGVWAVALDPHKMGLATIPGGVLVLRDGRDWALTAVESPYVSTDSQSTLMGTRPGAAVAAAWAVHRHLGRLGFQSLTETCLDNATWLAAQLQELGIEVVAAPELGVVTFRADDPGGLAAQLRAKGFGVNVVPRLEAIRVVCNPHVTRSALQKFLAALKDLGA